MPEIPCIDDTADMRIVLDFLANQRHRIVFGGIVDEDMLVVVLRQGLHHLANPLAKNGHVLFFVITGRYDGNFLFHSRNPLFQNYLVHLQKLRIIRHDKIRTAFRSEIRPTVAARKCHGLHTGISSGLHIG